MAKKKKKAGGRRRINIDRSMELDYEYHLPVLLEEAVSFLITDAQGTYIDGTLGGGGHAAAITKRLISGGKLLAFDKDEEAIGHCRVQFEEEMEKGGLSKIAFFNDSFVKACSMEEIIGKAKGILLDLGVSSRQLDSEPRGFSYRFDAPLDLRFGSVGQTAAELLKSASENEITEILRKYGEEPFAKRLARRIAEKRASFPVDTTSQLKNIIEESVPFKLRYKALSRVFQALRIAVNNELGELEKALEEILPVLDIGGRIVVISYHSLEDRIVKNFFRENAPKGKYIAPGEEKCLKILTKRPVTPDEEEIKRNPRARSAKLRVAEKVRECL